MESSSRAIKLKNSSNSFGHPMSKDYSDNISNLNTFSFVNFKRALFNFGREILFIDRSS